MKPAMDRVACALVLECAGATVREVKVNSAELAQSERFLGSPSVRVVGRDAEPCAGERHDYGFMCRTYREGGLSNPAPLLAMIGKAIQARRDS
jgi:hypothetical protein